MSVRTIEQAVFQGRDCLAKSPGLDSVTLETIGSLCANYGSLPEASLAMFVARPTSRQVVVARVQGIRSHVLVVPDRLYRGLHDPFMLVRTFPADYLARGMIDCVSWDSDRPAPRTLADIKRVLQSGDAPTLLGAAQALLDGGRVAFRRVTPDPILLEQVWTLLPDADRGELSLATFAPRNALQFRLVVTSNIDGPEYSGYLTEDQAGDYPEGRYELALQQAAEVDDAARIQDLLARRSGSQSLRLAFGMLISAFVAGLALKFIPWERLR